LPENPSTGRRKVHQERAGPRYHSGSKVSAWAAVANAVVDALAEFGVEHIELPATPERVWSAIRACRNGA
jgi:xanthine dehydrogenase molybdopterin-binding subunit B